MIRNAVKHALALLPEQVKDPIPYSIRMQHHLCELRYALEQIHFPDSMESKEIAKKRLVFEELFTLQLGLLELKYRKRRKLPCRLLSITATSSSNCFPSLPPAHKNVPFQRQWQI